MLMARVLSLELILVIVSALQHTHMSRILVFTLDIAFILDVTSCTCHVTNKNRHEHVISAVVEI